MKEYLLKDIIRDVRIAIDQNMDGESLSYFGDVDTLSLDDIISSKIVDAAMLILDSAPINMVGDVATDGSEEAEYKKVYNTDKSFYAEIVAPEDFFRLVLFTMQDWKKSVTDKDLIYPTDEEYAIQRSRIEGVRGSAENPVLAYVPKFSAVNNKFCFEAYSCKENEAYALSYIPMPTIVDEQKIALSQELYKAVVYATAYLTAIAFNSDNQAMRLLSVAKQLAKIEDPIQTPIISQEQMQQNMQQ